MKNDFIIAVNIRCEPKQFEWLLKAAGISCFNIDIQHPKIYYDEQTYFLFETEDTRQSFMSKVQASRELLVEINEISFCAKGEEEQ